MRKVFLTFITASVLSSFCFAGEPTAYSPEIAPYVKFIQQCDTDPVDYVMGLFDKYDIVILGERDHRDTTQYELIRRIISDQRFIDKVGHVITEIGANNMSANANRIINADMTDDEFYQAFVKHLRNADMNIFWEKFNFYLLHRDIRAINKNLTSDKKLDITYSGASILWNWNEMSREAYLKMHNYFDSKGDEIYAENAINRFCEIWQNSPRKKALIIYNRPHSYKEYPRKGERPFAAQLVIDRFPDRVANVMINWCGFDLLTGRKLTISPIQNGKWDAAFEVCDHKSIGFDFADSPFGADAFDHYSVPVDPTTYADVYNGFIFYKPINEWVSSIDYKGFVDDEFADEFCKRNMYMGDSEEDAKAYTEFMKNQETRSFQFDEEMLSPFYEQMNKYLHKPGTEKGK